ncbi:uncharacterized protein LOC111304230 isoform X2 [Durio zibethinus]|uniref:Auxin-responsive protein n=1 Tax=Durio zibethinus TaxID=66656 RepID=A0A6P5ZVP7_DURZI|nr:uncharacterized protein LOC111304230 isoform X2 [Durio zibethinus]
MCMELQLGLALPSTPIITIKMFDLNSYGYEPREALGSNTLSQPLLKLGPCDININSSSSSSSSSGGGSKKRGFDEVLLFDENRNVPKTLPLLLWTNKPNDEDDPKDLDDNSSSAIFEYLTLFLSPLFLFLYVCFVRLSVSLFILETCRVSFRVRFRTRKKILKLEFLFFFLVIINILDECMFGNLLFMGFNLWFDRNDGQGLVGWPPVKTWGKKLRREVPNDEADNNPMVAAAENGCGGSASNSTYVKVKMEGVAIARKIDLSVHHSFETLINTLMKMFGIRS